MKLKHRMIYSNTDSPRRHPSDKSNSINNVHPLELNNAIMLKSSLLGKIHVTLIYNII